MSEFPNSGIMNPNKYKRPGTKMPDYNGSCSVTCVHCKGETHFELAAWNRGKFTTIAFTEKSEANAKKAAYKARKAGLPVEGAEENQNGTHATDATDEPVQEMGQVPF
jgi:hypothetical protein